MFFSFDGLDGAGKTTQINLFCEWLRGAGHDVATCRDPGTTRLGEKVRGILLDPATAPISRRAEMLLYMAARAQLVEEFIHPTLAAGRTVVSDRYLLANVVYQGHAGGLDPDDLWEIGRVATGGLAPELTIVLDIDPQTADQRMTRERDRMEQQGDAFTAALRKGFLNEAARHADRIAVIDAGRTIDEVQADIRQAALRVLQRTK